MGHFVEDGAGVGGPLAFGVEADEMVGEEGVDGAAGLDGGGVELLASSEVPAGGEALKEGAEAQRRGRVDKDAAFGRRPHRPRLLIPWQDFIFAHDGSKYR